MTRYAASNHRHSGLKHKRATNRQNGPLSTNTMHLLELMQGASKIDHICLTYDLPSGMCSVTSFKATKVVHDSMCLGRAWVDFGTLSLAVQEV